jgi:hypothetical protein
VERLHLTDSGKLDVDTSGAGVDPKRVILAVTDFVTLGFALWLAMSLRLGEAYVQPSRELLFIFLAAPTIGVATFFQLGLYRLVTRYIGGQGAVLIPVAVALSAQLSRCWCSSPPLPLVLRWEARALVCGNHGSA